MKTHFNIVATAIMLALIGGCIVAPFIACAAVPLRWNVETSRAQPARYDVYRGETLQLTADLTSYGQPVSMAGTAALYIQTNGMGNAWWTIPATVSSNRIDATLSPSSYPATATTLNCFLGGPATSYRAAFVLRILGAPGPAPNTVEPPVVALDYDTITVLNAPYWTRDEADARYGGSSITATVVTNIAAAVVARDAIPKSNGVAENLTVGGEFRLDDGAGNYGTIQYGGNNNTDYTEWWAGVPGYWLGTYRLRNPGSGNTATIAFTSDIPDLGPYAAAAAVASNAVPRTVADATYATKAEMSGKLDASNGTANFLTVISPYDEKMVLGTSVDEYVTLVFGHSLGLVFDAQTRRLGVWPYPSGDYSNVDYLATASDVSSMVDSIPKTYAATNAIVAVNSSVQTVVDPPNNVLPAFQVPSAVPGFVRDWIVYVVSSGTTDITVTGFPSTVDGKTANFFSTTSTADITKACTHGTITIFTFSEVNSTTNAVNFFVMRSELQRVNQSN